MTFFLHVRRNIVRNPSRTFGVILVVGLTLGIFLILGQLGASIAAGADQAVASVPNLITVAGAQAGFGQPVQANITSSTISIASATPNVLSVQRLYNFPLSQASCLNGPCTKPSSSGSSSSCPFGASIDGEDTSSSMKIVSGIAGASNVNVTSGRALDAADENSTNALIGQQYANDNRLSVGDEVNVTGHMFNIVGIFSGSGCPGDTIIVPYPALASIFDIAHPSILYVTVNQYQNVGGVVSYLQNKLGSNYTVQDVASVNHEQFQHALSSVIFSSEVGEYAALITGASVMVVVMVLVTSRRIKEIGLLKALGYGNFRILSQLLSESLIIVLLGFPLALAVAFLIGPLIAQSLLSQIGGAAETAMGGSPSSGNSFLQYIHFAVTPETVIFGAAITVAFGVVGAFYPAAKALFLRPTEALRHE